jgi:hypothetical protein
MCLSLHPDRDGSINRTRNTLYLTHKKGSRQNSLQSFIIHEATINAYHYSATTGYLREANTILVCSDIVILFSQGPPPDITSHTTPGAVSLEISCPSPQTFHLETTNMDHAEFQRKTLLGK